MSTDDCKELPYQGTVVLAHGFARDIRHVLTCPIPDEVLDICASFRGMSFREVPDIYEYFEIEGELGRGASCRVLKVRNKKTNELSAMKEMRRDAKWNPVIFEQECRILQTLGKHKNIMDFKDCWVDRKNFYILSSVCTGGDLFDKMKKLRRFKERDAAKVVKVILETIKHCHDRNIAYRYLKPGNFLYKDANHEAEDLVLIDFADATKVEEHSTHDDYVGTDENVFYLAPESIRVREGWECKKSDMWSIGVIAYTLVTGRPPFWDGAGQEIIRKIILATGSSMTRLTDDCKAFILALLKTSPGDRLSAAEALKHPWITGEVHADIGEDMLRGLATFGTSNQLKRLIVATVAKNVDRKHRKQYESQFMLFDLENDGQVDWSELAVTLQKWNYPPNVAEAKAKAVVRHISGDENKPITKEAWFKSNVAKLLSSDHLIKRRYKKLDVDQNGLISVDDLLSIFEGIEKKKMEEIITEVDTDKNGEINFADFKRAMEFKPAYPLSRDEKDNDFYD